MAEPAHRNTLSLARCYRFSDGFGFARRLNIIRVLGMKRRESTQSHRGASVDGFIHHAA